MGGTKHDLLWVLPGSDYPANAFKLQARLSGYLPLGRGTVLAAAARAGRVVATTGSSVTIAPKRFFLGGADTIRGFSEEAMIPQDLRTELAARRAACALLGGGDACGADNDAKALYAGDRIASVGGQAFLLGKVELRQALPFGLELGLFLDAGNVWFDPRKVRLYELRPSAGFGLRAVTPVGPLVFDFGFNLKPDRNLNESTFAPHFTIGLF
jgi:outer membrane protein assembly factor BamA